MNLSQVFRNMAIDISRYLKENYGINLTRIDIVEDQFFIQWHDNPKYTIVAFYNDFDEYKDDFILLIAINNIKKERYESNNLNNVYQKIIYFIDHIKPRMLF